MFWVFGTQWSVHFDSDNFAKKICRLCLLGHAGTPLMGYSIILAGFIGFATVIKLVFRLFYDIIPKE